MYWSCFSIPFVHLGCNFFVFQGHVSRVLCGEGRPHQPKPGHVPMQQNHSFQSCFSLLKEISHTQVSRHRRVSCTISHTPIFNGQGRPALSLRMPHATLAPRKQMRGQLTSRMTNDVAAVVQPVRQIMPLGPGQCAFGFGVQGLLLI